LANKKIRITAGHLKSRYLSFDGNDSLKPTKSYIRETIFNVVNIHKNMTSLDLFSGSGILSAEAISRGIKKSILVENDKKSYKRIKQEFSLLGIDNYEIFGIDALQYLRNNDESKYDLIFLDPPYSSDLLEKCIITLDELSYLSKNTYIYYEQRKKDYNQKLVSIITKTHNVLKDLNIGDVSYTIAKIKEN
jgi:16S rRNA (guanine966-N2)-methyltransferase